MNNVLEVSLTVMVASCAVLSASVAAFAVIYVINCVRGRD